MAYGQIGMIQVGCTVVLIKCPFLSTLVLLFSKKAVLSFLQILAVFLFKSFADDSLITF